MTPLNRILITGAAGGVAKFLRTGLRGRYPRLRLSDVATVSASVDGEEIDQTDLSDFAAVMRMMDGVDAVIHLGALSVENNWEAILQANIIGTYNLFEAARRQGVRRILFASSNHVIGFYDRGKKLNPWSPPRPDSRYGLSKAFGEDTGRYFADKFGLEVLAIRIGSCFEKPANARMLSTWLSPADAVRLVIAGLETPNLHFDIIYGVSDNTRGWWDNNGAARIGYEPRDNAEIFAAEILGRAVPEDGDAVALRLQGGHFAAHEFSGNPNRL